MAWADEGGQTMTVTLDADTEALEERVRIFRLFLSQLGFACDNFLSEMHELRNGEDG